MKLGILISGGGTTAQAIIQATQNGLLQHIVTPVVVVSSNPNAAGILKAKQLGIPTEVIERKNYTTDKAFGTALIQIFQKYSVEFISQNGWLPLLPLNVINAFPKKIINQHPGPLDPGFEDFGGRGMYGSRVICARLLYCLFTQDTDPWTESDVHYVTEEFDRGNLIRTIKLGLPKVERRITPEDCEHSIPVQEYIKHASEQIQAKLLPIEHENIIASLKEFAEGKSPEKIREVRLVSDENLPYLHKAKKLAIQFFPKG